MGGLGSGYYRPRKRAVGECLVLDINELARQGLLGDRRREGRLRWHDRRTGERLLALSYHFERIDRQTGRLKLVYSVDGCHQEQTIALTTSRLVSVGRRWWFACPGCGRRAGKLYLPPDARRFGCRLCHRLAYP
jgi:hypothetical protein